MVEPVRNDKHGNGDRNDNEVAAKDAPMQQERKRESRKDEKDIEEETRRKTGAG